MRNPHAFTPDVAHEKQAGCFASSAAAGRLRVTGSKFCGRQNAPTTLGRVFCVLAMVTVMAAPVMAQETGDVTTTKTGWVFRWINFAIIFALIVWGFSKAGPYFRKTADQISEKIAEGKRAREAAENQRRMVQEKMSHLDAEVAQIRADAKRANENEAQRIRVTAKEEAQNIERAGQAEIAAAEHAARLELKAFAGRVAVEQAEVILRDQMTATTEAAVLRSFVESLDGSPN